MQKRTYSIVGANHTGKEAFLNALKPGTPVRLVREPLNQYDKNAVAVYVGDERVGYIPRKQNGVLALFIDQSGEPWTQNVGMAQDGETPVHVVDHHRTIVGTFRVSPNSAFPQVEV